MRKVPDFVDQAKSLIRTNGECTGNWRCKECVVAFMNPEVVDFCDYDIAEELSEEYLAKHEGENGRCLSIWNS
jgi:hypothetical protein